MKYIEKSEIIILFFTVEKCWKNRSKKLSLGHWVSGEINGFVNEIAWMQYGCAGAAQFDILGNSLNIHIYIYIRFHLSVRSLYVVSMYIN